MFLGPPNKTPDPKNCTAPPGFEIPGSATDDKSCTILHLPKKSLGMVAYFCHHLSDNYVDLPDLYVVLSDLYVDLSLIHLLKK